MFSSNIIHYEYVISIQTVVIATSLKTKGCDTSLYEGLGMGFTMFSPKQLDALVSQLSVSLSSLCLYIVVSEIWKLKLRGMSNGSKISN